MKIQYQILVLTILTLSVLCISCSDLKRDTSSPTSSVSKNYSPYNCNACHGNETNAAPPKDLEGNTSISSPGVGAHQSHLLASHSVGAVVACNECHVIPSVYNAPGHLDTTPGAEVVFQGSVSTSRFSRIAGADTAARFSDATLYCANTYCHGCFPNGNRVSPMWTDESGQYRACGSCHGDVTKSAIGDRALPRTSLTGGFHPKNTNCSQCHSRTINASYQLNALQHINGQIDYN